MDLNPSSQHFMPGTTLHQANRSIYGKYYALGLQSSVKAFMLIIHNVQTTTLSILGIHTLQQNYVSSGSYASDYS